MNISGSPLSQWLDKKVRRAFWEVEKNLTAYTLVSLVCLPFYILGISWLYSELFFEDWAVFQTDPIHPPYTSDQDGNPRTEFHAGDIMWVAWTGRIDRACDLVEYHRAIRYHVSDPDAPPYLGILGYNWVNLSHSATSFEAPSPNGGYTKAIIGAALPKNLRPGKYILGIKEEATCEAHRPISNELATLSFVVVPPS